MSLHSPQCTSCSPGQSRIDTARSWNSAALGAEAKPASRGRRDRHAGSHRNCKGTRGCHTTFSVEAEVLSGVITVAKILSPWSLAVVPQFASSTSLRFREPARAASGLFSVRVGIPPESGILSQHQALSPIPREASRSEGSGWTQAHWALCPHRIEPKEGPPLGAQGGTHCR